MGSGKGRIRFSKVSGDYTSVEYASIEKAKEIKNMIMGAKLLGIDAICYGDIQKFIESDQDIEGWVKEQVRSGIDPLSEALLDFDA
jgi:hypothetical protein